MYQLRVMLVDDHTLFRDGLRLLIQSQPDMLVVGEASDGASAARLAASCEPDIVLMDLHLPGKGGLEATVEVLRVRPAAKVIALTMYHDDILVDGAIKSGASGYMLKDSRSAELLQAIRVVASGGAALESSIAAQLLDLYRHPSRQAQMAQSPDDSSPPGNDAGLTAREVEVLDYLADGLSNRQIARKLYLSEQTIKNVLSSIYHKLGVSNRTEAVMLALGQGLLKRGR